MHNDRPETRLATRLAFAAAGFAMSCWAPLVPFAKQHVGVDEAGLGLLLLCLGGGSVLAMPLTGWLSARIGSKPLVLAGGLGLGLVLPLLMLAPSAAALALALLGFGAALGTMDVAMNIHAVEVERDAPVPLMSGFHAMFSIGGFLGAGGMTLLLATGLAPVPAALCGSLVTLGAVLAAWPRLLAARGAEQPMPLALPRGIVLLLAALAGAAFLVEGAMLDWGALLITARDLLEPAQAGLGYMVFSAAMTLGRLTGDRVVARLGGTRVLAMGGTIAALGILCLLLSPGAMLALAGFGLVGLGASNIVPVLFSMAGRQDLMPPALAIAAVTTMGYGGILLGPALLGFIAHHFSLQLAFALLAVLMVLVAATARKVAAGVR